MRTFRPSFKVDYAKLIAELVGDRKLVRSCFYSAVPAAPSIEQTRFLNRLKYLGLSLVLRPLTKHRGTVAEKGVDVAIATDLVSMAIRDQYDAAILVSGDRDLEQAVVEAKASGKRVEIASFEHVICKELKSLADQFFPLDSMVPEIVLVTDDKLGDFNTRVHTADHLANPGPSDNDYALGE